MGGRDYLPVSGNDDTYDAEASTADSSFSRSRYRPQSNYQRLRSSILLARQRFVSLPRHRQWKLFLSFAAVVLVCFFPIMRHDYIKTFPKKAIKDLQDPHWWIDPWTLPSSRFPKVSLYPDPDWNPTPVWLQHPVQELRSHPSPSTFVCEDDTHPFYPVSHAQSPSFSGATTSSPLLFLGIFSAVNKTEMRNLIRKRQLPHYKGTMDIELVLGRNDSYAKHPWGDMDIPPGILEAKFILGYPPGWSNTVAMFRDGTLKATDPDIEPFALAVPGNRATENAFVTWNGYGVKWWRRWLPVPWTQGEIRTAKEHLRLMQMAAEEQGVFGDLELLPLEDSIVLGKTYHYFRWLAQTRSQDRPPRFAMKTDDDTFHVIPNLLSIFTSLSCGTSYYIGNSWGCSQPYPFHFGGLGYALSWPLLSWLGAGDELPPRHTDDQEDARLGSYFTALDHQKDPVVTLDYSVLMGSFFDDKVFPQNTDTIALHYLKQPEAYRDYSDKMWNIWRSAGKEWKLKGGNEWVQRHSHGAR